MGRPAPPDRGRQARVPLLLQPPPAHHAAGSRGGTAGLAGGIVKNTNPAAPKAPLARGAVHSAEIEYALGNLVTNKIFALTPDDYKVSETMQAYFANFVKTGTPNPPGLPNWAPINRVVPAPVMHLDVNTRLEPEQHRDRYLLLDQIF
ncbi:carboxylesterase family protein [Hymenobacter gelipurpurascens]|uniref:carboxylesterase family protein n=1 Tax=Hymenobacter gelipurpurascens TaxID=89968 RepID=UPI001FE80B1B|nr:carboxylesterase family protein [Hymenobacter gelipurpurascens]